MFNPQRSQNSPRTQQQRPSFEFRPPRTSAAAIRRFQTEITSLCRILYAKESLYIPSRPGTIDAKKEPRTKVEQRYTNAWKETIAAIQRLDGINESGAKALVRECNLHELFRRIILSMVFNTAQSLNNEFGDPTPLMRLEIALR